MYIFKVRVIPDYTKFSMHLYPTVCYKPNKDWPIPARTYSFVCIYSIEPIQCHHPAIGYMYVHTSSSYRSIIRFTPMSCFQFPTPVYSYTLSGTVVIMSQGYRAPSWWLSIFKTVASICHLVHVARKFPCFYLANGIVEGKAIVHRECHS